MTTTAKAKKVPITQAHLALLKKRGISEEIAINLGWKSIENPRAGGEWICFPYLRDGIEVGCKYRRILKGDKMNFYQDEGSEQCFYNLDAVISFRKQVDGLAFKDAAQVELVITEGEMDCAIALQCGYLAVSVPAGAPNKAIEREDSTKFDFLKDIPDSGSIILAVDADPPGLILQQEIAKRVGWHRCKVLKYPNAKVKDPSSGEERQVKDINDVFMVYGQAGVDATLRDHSQFINQGGLFRMSELPPVAVFEALGCGIDNLNENVKFRPGEITVVTGIPSFGKTTVVNEIAGNMAMNYGQNVCFASFEQSPLADHRRQLRTYYLACPPEDARIDHLAEADAWIDKHFSFIVPDINADEFTDLKWLQERIRAAVSRFKISMAVIDPWNEIDHDKPPGMSLTDYVGFALKQIRRMAKKYAIHVIIVAHPSKLEKNPHTGQYGIPSLYDISDSAHWYNKPDLGLVIHQFYNGETDQRYTLIRVQKVRYFNIIGKPCDKYFEFAEYKARFIASDYTPKKEKTKKELAKDAKVIAAVEGPKPAPKQSELAVGP